MSFPSEHWSALLDAIEGTLREVSTAPVAGSRHTQAENQAVFDSEHAKYREIKSFNDAISDDEFWHAIHLKPFLAGVRPPKKEKLNAAAAILSDFRKLAQPEWLSSAEAQAYMKLDIAEAEADEGDDITSNAGDAQDKPYWNKNKTKGPRIIKAATKLFNRSQERGLSLVDLTIPRRYRRWRREDIEATWQNMRTEIGFGPITTYHAMTDLGIPVVKPDRMLVRTVVRLGLIEAYGDPLDRAGRSSTSLTLDSQEALKYGQSPAFVRELQPIMQEAAAASGRSIREVDWLFAKMGMSETEEEGREFVICAEKPLCEVCRASPFCAYGKRYRPELTKPAFQRSRKKKSVRAKPRPEKPALVAAE